MLLTSAGAISTFLGTTRDIFEGKVVTSLSYESYIALAVESMKDICRKVVSSFFEFYCLKMD